jgi:hypothetical protein
MANLTGKRTDFMNKSLICAGAFTLLAAMAARAMAPVSHVDPDFRGVTNLTQQASLPATLSHLEVENTCGTINVRGTDGGPTRWTWNLCVRARTDALAREFARQVQCRIEIDGDRVKLIVSAPETIDARRIESDFQITVPKSASVDTQTHNGLTEISDLAGDVKALDDNGPVGIHRIGGTVRAETSGARLAVSDASAATLRNQNGEIDASDINGALDARTTFASLEAENIDGLATLTNQNGDIRASFIRGGLDAGATFGSITAHNIEGPVALRNQNGNVEVARAPSVTDFRAAKTTPTS